MPYYVAAHGGNRLARFGQTVVEHVEQVGRTRLARLQQSVALGQKAVVTHHGIEVGAVGLRDEGVELAAALLGGISLYGGRGTVLNVTLGVAILSVVGTGLAARGSSASLVQLVTGALLLTVITVEFLAGRLALGNTVFGRAIPHGGGRRSPEAG